jgi:hypothetical protein
MRVNRDKVPRLDFSQCTPTEAVMLLNAILEARRFLEEEGITLQIRTMPIERPKKVKRKD